MNAAVITARRGSKDKNVWEVLGTPIVAYPINSAWLCSMINEVHVTTDSEAVAKVARGLMASIIERPAELATDEANHGDAIVHAVSMLPNWIENVVVMLGNSVMVEPEHIFEALKLLGQRPELDSVMSVMALEDIHPTRSHTIDIFGHLGMYLDTDGPVSTNRQDYVPTYAFDGRLWAFRKEVASRVGSIKPWFWMGNKCAPLILPFPPVRDVHDRREIEISEMWLRRNYGIK